MTPSELKVCKTCGAEKDPSLFYKSRSVCKKCENIQKVRYRKLDPDHRAKHAAMMREFRKRPEEIQKARARQKLKNEINKGKIVKLPCQVCGNIEVEAHHPDYSKPLDVKWLCIMHHRMEHGTWLK